MKLHRRSSFIRRLIAIFVLFGAISPVSTLAHAPGCNTDRCDARAYQTWLRLHQYTGYTVSGKISTFGPPGEGSDEITADGGSASRPCIAIRDDSSLDHYFMVEVLGHKARLLHCDFGPAESTGRSIDITGAGAYALGLDPLAFPTESEGIARELR